VLISMVFFPSKNFLQMLAYITQNHHLVLSTFVVNELIEVTNRKFPTKRPVIDYFLENLNFELVYTPTSIPANLFHIRDSNDYPVLYSAITNNINIFITGDKDFQNIYIEDLEILTPTEFIQKYI
ncbi:MAG: PIN domain nuclease, partial [Lachnospiraceae bacterium]|nr:PIN domain nuclease [Lachnospiraceae bacterium]